MQTPRQYPTPGTLIVDAAALGAVCLAVIACLSLPGVF